tara:strand:- start:304 stop:1092 length:789 start_codon:yes stop_codon:yes gene_type:complete
MTRPKSPLYPESKNILQGKTVLVTASAGTGIGFATAKRCAEEGATVMLSDIHEARLKKATAVLTKEIDRPVYSSICDVSSDEQVQNLVDQAISAMGSLDVLVNNAGMGMTRSLIDTDIEDWKRLLDINLTGSFRMMKATLPVMIEQGGGVIINISSICAWRAEAGQTAYGASKAGLLALTRCAAMETAQHNIRVNAVVPSLALHPYLEKVSSADFLQKMISQNEVFGRAAEPWEVGNTIVFLASDYSGFMTGESLSVSCRRA